MTDWLSPCPACATGPSAADDGHAICRRCEGKSEARVVELERGETADNWQAMVAMEQQRYIKTRERMEEARADRDLLAEALERLLEAGRFALVSRRTGYRSAWYAASGVLSTTRKEQPDG